MSEQKTRVLQACDIEWVCTFKYVLMCLSSMELGARMIAFLLVCIFALCSQQMQ